MINLYVRLKELPIVSQSVLIYDPTSEAAPAYR